MQIIKFFRYAIEFLVIISFFLIFRILGIKISSYISGKIISLIGPFFRSKETINNNLLTAFPNITKKEIKEYANNMWNYYGRILAEYPFLKNFRNNSKKTNIEIVGKEILDNLKKK